MNDLYNAQEVIMLCELGKNRFQFMHDRYGFNPRKCKSASTLSGCIEREMSRVIIALPTFHEVIDIFEQTTTGGFSSVNTRSTIDTEILLANLIQKNSEEDSQKDYNYKVCYNIKLNDDKEYMKKRVITKILKLHENSQYEYGMTKLLPTTGCIKENFDVTWSNFNLLLEKVSLDDQIGHLYVVDIEFDHKKATENEIAYNEIYPPTIEKQKIKDPCEWSVYQLLDQYSATEKGNPRTYRATKKVQATLFKKKFIRCIRTFFVL